MEGGCLATGSASASPFAAGITTRTADTDERGRYEITLAPKAGDAPMDDTGKYITIYQRQSNGSWKIARDIWNSDQPLPGTK